MYSTYILLIIRTAFFLVVSDTKHTENAYIIKYILHRQICNVIIDNASQQRHIMTSFLWRTKMPPLLENRLSFISFLKMVESY